MMHNRPARWLLADAIRFSVITLDTGRDATRKNVKAEAFEYSYVYESEAHAAPNRLDHGYVLAFGDTCVFVQHTSTHVITSDDVKPVLIAFCKCAFSCLLRSLRGRRSGGERSEPQRS